MIKLYEHLPIYYIAIGLLTTPMISQAAINADELVHSCTSQVESDERYCKIYLQGFVDGAVTTDPQVAERVIDEAQNSGGEGLSDFVSRALKTRISQKLSRYGASYFADFCLPEIDPELTILESIKKKADRSINNQGPARDWVYGFLKTHFPC